MCPQQAQFTFQCKSKGNWTTGIIVCGGQLETINCSSNTEETRLTFEFTDGNSKLICSGSCGINEEKFSIEIKEKYLTTTTEITQKYYNKLLPTLPTIQDKTEIFGITIPFNTKSLLSKIPFIDFYRRIKRLPNLHRDCYNNNNNNSRTYIHSPLSLAMYLHRTLYFENGLF